MNESYHVALFKHDLHARQFVLVRKSHKVFRNFGNSMFIKELLD